MKLIFNTGIPEATWWPDSFGDGTEDDVLDVIKSGENSVFLYFEDYLNYTSIIDGKYIISGFDNNTKIGDWLVDIKVFGSIENVKAIACIKPIAVKILHEVESIGPDGLAVKKCYCKIAGAKKLA